MQRPKVLRWKIRRGTQMIMSHKSPNLCIKLELVTRSLVLRHDFAVEYVATLLLLKRCLTNHFTTMSPYFSIVEPY